MEADKFLWMFVRNWWGLIEEVGRLQARRGKTFPFKAPLELFQEIMREQCDDVYAMLFRPRLETSATVDKKINNLEIKRLWESATDEELETLKHLTRRRAPRQRQWFRFIWQIALSVAKDHKPTAIWVAAYEVTKISSARKRQKTYCNPSLGFQHRSTTWLEGEAYIKRRGGRLEKVNKDLQ